MSIDIGAAHVNQLLWRISPTSKSCRISEARQCLWHLGSRMLCGHRNTGWKGPTSLVTGHLEYDFTIKDCQSVKEQMGKLRPTGRSGCDPSKAKSGPEPRILILSSRIHPGSDAASLWQEHIFSNMKKEKKKKIRTLGYRANVRVAVQIFRFSWQNSLGVQILCQVLKPSKHRENWR